MHSRVIETALVDELNQGRQTYTARGPDLANRLISSDLRSNVKLMEIACIFHHISRKRSVL